MHALADVESRSLEELFNHPSLNAQRREIGPGQALFGPNESADRLFYVASGQIRLFKVGSRENRRLLDILGPGDWLGVAALTEAASYDELAVAAEATTVLAARSVALMGLLSQAESAVTAELIRQLALKVQSARDDSARLVFDDCNRRLVQTLVRFSRTAAASSDGRHIVLSITHHQLAQAVGAARETVSLALTQLRQRNLLRTGRNRLIFDLEQMRLFERWAEGRVELMEAGGPLLNRG